MSYAQAGRPAPSDELKTSAEYLHAFRYELTLGDQTFALSLLEAYNSPRGASPKQAYWIVELAKRIEQKSAAPKPTQLDLAKITQMFAEASKTLQNPRLLVDSEVGVLRITQSRNARFPGLNIQINGDGGWESRQWVGSISLEGVYTPVRGTNKERTPAVVAALEALAADPVGVAKAYGQKFGVCCFCARTLTDKRSVFAGYGPVCAERFGLDWGQCEEVVEPTTASVAATLNEIVKKLPAVCPEILSYGISPDDPRAQIVDEPINDESIDKLADSVATVHEELGEWVRARKAEGWTLDAICDRLIDVGQIGAIS